MIFIVFLLLSYALLNTVAMAAAKSGMRQLVAGVRGAAIGWLALGGSVYLVVLGVLSLLLRRGEASTIFPIAIGCTVVVTNIVGSVFYAERQSWRKFIGLALIVSGIALTFLGGSPGE